MATLALIIAVVALVIAIAAYRRTGGVGELQNQIQTLSSTTDVMLPPLLSSLAPSVR